MIEVFARFLFWKQNYYVVENKSINPETLIEEGVRVFDATFNNISAI